MVTLGNPGRGVWIDHVSGSVPVYGILLVCFRLLRPISKQTTLRVAANHTATSDAMCSRLGTGHFNVADDVKLNTSREATPRKLGQTSEKVNTPLLPTAVSWNKISQHTSRQINPGVIPHRVPQQ
jgi:hypothetical protein